MYYIAYISLIRPRLLLSSLGRRRGLESCLQNPALPQFRRVAVVLARLTIRLMFLYGHLHMIGDHLCFQILSALSFNGVRASAIPLLYFAEFGVQLHRTLILPVTITLFRPVKMQDIEFSIHSGFLATSMIWPCFVVRATSNSILASFKSTFLGFFSLESIQYKFLELLSSLYNVLIQNQWRV